MKFKATKKEMKDGYTKIISIGYCDAEQLLNYENPIAYSAGGYGWACDYYDIDGVLISTGYRTIADKNARHDYQLIEEYNDKARKIVHGDMDYTQKPAAVKALLNEFIQDVTNIVADADIKKAQAIIKRIGGYRELIFLRTPCTIKKAPESVWNSEHQVVQFITKNTEPDGHADTISIDIVTGQIVG